MHTTKHVNTVFNDHDITPFDWSQNWSDLNERYNQQSIIYYAKYQTPPPSPLYKLAWMFYFNCNYEFLIGLRGWYLTWPLWNIHHVVFKPFPHLRVVWVFVQLEKTSSTKLKTESEFSSVFSHTFLRSYFCLPLQAFGFFIRPKNISPTYIFNCWKQYVHTSSLSHMGHWSF